MGGPEQRVMTPLLGIPLDPLDPLDLGACSQKLVWSNAPSLLLTFAVRAPPGAAAGAAAAEFREASFGATFHHFCLLLLSAPPSGAAAGAAAAEFRQASFGATLHHFCLLLLSAPPPGAAAGVAPAEFREASLGATLYHFYYYCCLRPPPRLGLLLVLPLLNSEKQVWE